MTICIAAACREEDESRIVICMDSRLDDVYTSSDKAVKLDTLGHNWFTLISGDWIPATELSKFLSVRVHHAPCPAFREDIFNLVKQSTGDFQSSPFCEANCRIELIVGGFVFGEPMLMYTGYEGGTPYTRLASEVAVIGSGLSIAMPILRIRKYRASISVRRAIYLVYEAKRYSENAPSVGPKTAIAILYPNGNARSLGRPYYRKLEDSRQRFGLQPINLEALPDPQFPIDGLSLQ